MGRTIKRTNKGVLEATARIVGLEDMRDDYGVARRHTNEELVAMVNEALPPQTDEDIIAEYEKKIAETDDLATRAACCLIINEIRNKKMPRPSLPCFAYDLQGNFPPTDLTENARTFFKWIVDNKDRIRIDEEHMMCDSDIERELDLKYEGEDAEKMRHEAFLAAANELRESGFITHNTKAHTYFTDYAQSAAATASNEQVEIHKQIWCHPFIEKRRKNKLDADLTNYDSLLQALLDYPDVRADAIINEWNRTHTPYPLPKDYQKMLPASVKLATKETEDLTPQEIWQRHKPKTQYTEEEMKALLDA